MSSGRCFIVFLMSVSTLPKKMERSSSATACAEPQPTVFMSHKTRSQGSQREKEYLMAEKKGKTVKKKPKKTPQSYFFFFLLFFVIELPAVDYFCPSPTN